MTGNTSTTTCSITSTSSVCVQTLGVQAVDNPNFDIALVIFLFLVVFFGFIFYFRTPSNVMR